MKNEKSIVLCLLIAAACVRCGGAGKAETRIATPVKVRPVVSFKAGDEIRYSANIQPRQTVDLAFKVGGYVEELQRVRDAEGVHDIQEGDHVARGTVLARLRKSDYEARIRQVEGSLGEAKSEAERAAQDYQRASSLFESSSITRSDMDAAKARTDSARFRVEATLAQLEEVKIALQDSDLTAPMDAIVIKRDVEAGDLVSPGSPGFVLADSTEVKAVFGVPDLSIDKFRPGQKLAVVLEAIPGIEFRGVITRVSPAADRNTRLFDTEIRIPNPENRIKSGMIATILVRGSASPAPLMVVPITAIVRSLSKADQYAVIVVEDDGARKIARLRDVTLGETYGDTIAVPTGLRSGELVITTGATLVNDGDEVKIIP